MRVACVLGPKFEDSEFKEPYDALHGAGLQSHDRDLVTRAAEGVVRLLELGILEFRSKHASDSHP